MGTVREDGNHRSEEPLQRARKKKSWCRADSYRTATLQRARPERGPVPKRTGVPALLRDCALRFVTAVGRSGGCAGVNNAVPDVFAQSITVQSSLCVQDSFLRVES